MENETLRNTIATDLDCIDWRYVDLESRYDLQEKISNGIMLLADAVEIRLAAIEKRLEKMEKNISHTQING